MEPPRHMHVWVHCPRKAHHKNTKSNQKNMRLFSSEDRKTRSQSGLQFQFIEQESFPWTLTVRVQGIDACSINGTRSLDQERILDRGCFPLGRPTCICGRRVFPRSLRLLVRRHRNLMNTTLEEGTRERKGRAALCFFLPLQSKGVWHMLLFPMLTQFH